MVALGLDGGVHNLVVEKLRRLRLARNPPIVIVDEPAKKPELGFLVQYLDLDEIAELPPECLDALLKSSDAVLNLRPQQRLHAASCKLRLQFIHRSGGITEQEIGRAHV